MRASGRFGLFATQSVYVRYLRTFETFTALLADRRSAVKRVCRVIGPHWGCCDQDLTSPSLLEELGEARQIAGALIF